MLSETPSNWPVNDNNRTVVAKKRTHSTPSCMFIGTCGGSHPIIVFLLVLLRPSQHQRHGIISINSLPQEVTTFANYNTKMVVTRMFSK
jgi:hypothetical protein